MAIEFPTVNKHFENYLLSNIVNWNVESEIITKYDTRYALNLVFKEDLQLIKFFNSFRNDILFSIVILENYICENVILEEFFIKNGYIFLKCSFNRKVL